MLKSIKSTSIFSTGNSYRNLNISTVNLNKCIILLHDSNNHYFWMNQHLSLNKELLKFLEE